jgi:hypothetical protein
MMMVHRYPDDFESRQPEERNYFKRTRFDIEDVLRDCSAVLGPTTMLSILVEQLKQSANAADGAHKDWMGVEAAYHCMGALKDEGLPHCLPMVLEVCPSCLSRWAHAVWERGGQYLPGSSVDGRLLPGAAWFLKADEVEDRTNSSRTSLPALWTCACLTSGPVNMLLST